MTQSLNHDMFSGYFMDPIPKFMKSNACYNLNSGWTNAAWQCTYGYVYTEVQKAEKNFYGNDNLKGYLGINRNFESGTDAPHCRYIRSAGLPSTG